MQRSVPQITQIKQLQDQVIWGQRLCSPNTSQRYLAFNGDHLSAELMLITAHIVPWAMHVLGHDVSLQNRQQSPEERTGE